MRKLKITFTLIGILSISIISFNGLVIKTKSDPSIINDKLRHCIYKYAYFFPISTQGSGETFFNPSSNFLQFCHCRHPNKKALPNLEKLTQIDFCSNQHLDAFEHHQLFELTAKMIIEPDISDRLTSQLRFVGPAIEKRSIFFTHHCMLKTIMKDCRKHFTLNRMQKCAENYLQDNWLYQGVYKNCQSLKFDHSFENTPNQI